MKFWLLPLLLFCCLAAESHKTVLVTGATGELGGAAAKQLSQNYRLILAGRDLGKLEALQQELGANHKLLCFDYREAESIQIAEPLDAILLLTPRPRIAKDEVLEGQEAWLELLQETFTGPIELLRTTLPLLRPGGSIVVIAGTTSVQLQPQYGPASVIRRMWTTYVKSLAHKLGPKRIRVNALSPGVVLTEHHRDRIAHEAEEAGLDWGDQLRHDVLPIPLGRHAIPQEVAEAAQFLISDQASFITGINLLLDGGYTQAYP